MQNFINVYDDDIQRFHNSFNLPFDWLILKAQLIQESGLNPMAVSPVGAMGLAQFMPDTWADYVVKYPIPNTSVFNAHASIYCCANYMADLLKGWKAERSEEDRYKLALASYNAGFGNILAAQRLAHGVADYNSIIAKLPMVTGSKNAKETTTYVRKIFEYYHLLKT